MAEPNPLDEHFRSPRSPGILEDADISVRVENPVCGDILHLYWKRDAGGRIEASRFQVYGCPAAIAAGSLVTEAVRGRSRDEVDELTREHIATALGGLATEKMHAAALARDGIEAALREWRRGPKDAGKR